MQKGKENLIKFGLWLTIIVGLYLIAAWASYSPLDNAWTVAGSLDSHVFNKTGQLGAILADLLLAAFGSVAVWVPLGLAFSAAYVLFRKRTFRLTWKMFWIWLGWFGLFIWGLTGLASVLLNNTAYYLSGGFLGGMLNGFFTDWPGQFGVLFISMVLTAVGFYFCSGTILWQLFNRLYQWIFEQKGETEPEPEQNRPLDNPSSEPNEVKSVANTAQESIEPDFVKKIKTAQSEPVVAEEESPPQPLQKSGFTDIAGFSRPNISGLKTTQRETEPESVVRPSVIPAVEKMPLTDLSAFTVEKPTLPHIHLEESIAEPVKPISKPNVEMEEMQTAFEPPAMPKIRLNPVENTAVQPTIARADETLSQPIWEEKEIEIEAASPHIRLTEQQEKPSLAAVEEESLMAKPIQPVIEEKEAQKPSYPKGYGESLIHPLLQKKTKLEKPNTPLPTLDLLAQNVSAVAQITEEEILATSARIEQELANFGVKATVEDVLVGPVVTRYEIKPAAGVKASKITNLDSDLARALIFKAIRITDVVPGKPYMGIETPNKERETVWLRDVLASEAFQKSKATLPMALGKDISGEPVVVDMAKMPHLLVAGQTGGGKSVGVNTMILSLLYKLTPEQVRFIMIDPKVVELSIYNDIPHLLTPVVTDMKKAENALRWAVEEMERRYLLVSSLSVRNIEGYNDKIRQAEEMSIPIPNPIWRPGDTMDAVPPPLEKLSYIVLIVDEFADLMMSAGKQVEDHIMRIAQKARAVGIHLILATQRPSTDVITGVIKANIPSRIAFTVASQIDSRTILDKGGAESLLGRGDMLYSGAGSPDIIRVHGAFMTDDDVQRVADNWRARSKPSYIDSIVESAAEEDESVDGRASSELDPKFDEIAQYVIDGGLTSISGIQRRFALGFNRAARIIDQLEAEGILSAPDSRGKREVLAR